VVGITHSSKGAKKWPAIFLGHLVQKVFLTALRIEPADIFIFDEEFNFGSGRAAVNDNTIRLVLLEPTVIPIGNDGSAAKLAYGRCSDVEPFIGPYRVSIRLPALVQISLLTKFLRH